MPPMPATTRRFPLFGWLGLLVIGIGMFGIFAPVAVLSRWATPICWWGYILFADALLKRLAGWSMLCDRRREFFFAWLPLSIVFWVVFEVFNLHLVNWRYVGLAENMVERMAGYAAAFATILPGMFLSAEILLALRVFRPFRVRPVRIGGGPLLIMGLLGLFFLIGPLLFPTSIARYLFAFVWMGFFFFLDPINLSSGVDSVLGELEEGRLEGFLAYMTAGFWCGLLWEFWNFWALTKWQYVWDGGASGVPFTQGLRYFEMPLAGFLGFGPFALEYRSMYQFCRIFLRRGEREAGE
jgi:hypothetical protein